MAKSAIAGLNRQERRIDAQINKQLKKVELAKAKEAKQKAIAAKKKKLADLRKRS